MADETKTDVQAEPEKAFSARDLIEETAQEEGTFEVRMKSGNKIVVRRVVNYRTLVSLRKRAANIMRLAEKGGVPASWKPYLPITEAVADIVADITGLVVSPKFTDVEVLELCAKSGMAATYLHGLIKKSWSESVGVAEEEEIEEEKNA